MKKKSKQNAWNSSRASSQCLDTRKRNRKKIEQPITSNREKKAKREKKPRFIFFFALVSCSSCD